MTYGDVITGQIVTSSVKLHQEAPKVSLEFLYNIGFVELRSAIICFTGTWNHKFDKAYDQCIQKFVTIVKAFLYRTDCIKHKRKRSKLHLSLNLAYHCIRQTLRIHVFLVVMINLCMLLINAVILLFQ